MLMQFNLLRSKHPILADPDLAKRIGLNEAIVLQKFNYLIQRNIETKNPRSYHDGKYWTFNSYKNWHEKYFYWWSVRTVRRTITSLRKQELIFSDNFNRAGFDNTQWYTINFDNKELYKQRDDTVVQNGQRERPNWTGSSGVQNGQANTIEYPYTNQTSGSEEQDHSLENKYKIEACKTIDYLDKVTGKHFKHSKTSLRPIIARLRDDHLTSKKVKHIIDVKVYDWLNSEKMNKFLNPKTLFRASNYEYYLNQPLPNNTDQGRNKTETNYQSSDKQKSQDNDHMSEFKKQAMKRMND